MIQPPKYAPNALPRPNGWYVKNEKIVGRRFTQEEIDEYMDHINGPKKTETKAKSKKKEIVEEPVKTDPPPIIEKEEAQTPEEELVEEKVLETKKRRLWPFGSK